MRGVSCITYAEAQVKDALEVIVPVRGVSCITGQVVMRVLMLGHRPREGSELHRYRTVGYNASIKSSSP